MEIISVGAVLMIGHFVVSIFQVQLGNPIIYSLPFVTMEQCEKYKSYMPSEPIKMDLERSKLCFFSAAKSIPASGFLHEHFIAYS